MNDNICKHKSEIDHSNFFRIPCDYMTQTLGCIGFDNSIIKHNNVIKG